MESSQIERIINVLWQPGARPGPAQVYAFVDAARSESIYPRIMDADTKTVCLHRGERARELAWVAPYLVRLTPEASFTQWLLRSGWGKSRTIFIKSSATLNELKCHFRTILTVYDTEGKSYFFRFYDPRVLRTYLPTCNESEIKKVFGPVDHFIMEQEEPDQAYNFFRTGSTLAMESITLG